MRRFAILAVLAAAPVRADEPLRLYPEIDPLPFALGGYGTQLGVRHDDVVPRLRVALASFALDVPDAVAELGGNDGFGIQVRPSAAVYVLYYHGNIALGGAMRYLRLRYTHDDVDDVHRDTRELSPEAIVGYRWHPTSYGFYVQPWLGLSATLWRSDETRVGDRTYDPMPVQLFVTVNVGWELVL